MRSKRILGEIDPLVNQVNHGLSQTDGGKNYVYEWVISQQKNFMGNFTKRYSSGLW
ncbi:hypothetical protein RhiirA5_436818 [Rhizophagus irregularis]|uniref:Uncharacterized protein n=1 Tax=Rhizophagus irregularis TaxID=588596 RepID=A0A2N0NLC9_9GLOM|nr:hypothetical protein RhiirA5_436818 [Rhizophagus irregularis]